MFPMAWRSGTYTQPHLTDELMYRIHTRWITKLPLRIAISGIQLNCGLNWKKTAIV